MFCRVDCPEYQCCCAEDIHHLKPPLPFLLYLMNIIGLIIYFIPAKKKPVRFCSPDLSLIKAATCEDFVYDRGKGDECEEIYRKPEKECAELIKTDSDDCLNKYYPMKKDECQDPCKEESNECSGISYDKKIDEWECSYETVPIGEYQCYDKSEIEEFENYKIMKKKCLQLQQDRVRIASISRGERIHQPYKPEDINCKKVYKRNPQLKIFVETTNKGHFLNRQEEINFKNKCKTEIDRIAPKITYIRAPSVDECVSSLEKVTSTHSVKEVVTEKVTTPSKRTSVVSQFSLKMNELDEKIEAKMVKIRSYSPQHEDIFHTIRRGTAFPNILMPDEESITEEINEQGDKKEREPSYLSYSPINVLSESNIYFKADKVSYKSPDESYKSPNVSVKSEIVTQNYKDVGEEKIPVPEIKEKEKSPIVQPVEILPRVSLDRTSLRKFSSDESRHSFRRLSIKSSGTSSFSVNSLSLVDTFEAMALAKLIKHELGYVINNNEGSEDKRLKTALNSTVIQRSEIELLNLPSELLRVQKKIESKLDSIIRQGGPKYCYVKALKKYLPYMSNSSNPTIYPCKINYGRSSKILYQKLLKKLWKLRKLRKKYSLKNNTSLCTKGSTDNDSLLFNNKTISKKVSSSLKSKNYSSNQLNETRQQEKLLVEKLYKTRSRIDTFPLVANKIEDHNQLVLETSNPRNKFSNWSSKLNLEQPKPNNSSNNRIHGEKADIKKEDLLQNKANVKKTFRFDSNGFERSTIHNNSDSCKLIKKVFDNYCPKCHASQTEKNNRSNKALKLKAVNEDLKRIYCDLNVNLQNLQKFLSRRSLLPKQNAGDGVAEACRNIASNQESSQNVLRTKPVPIFSKQEPKSNLSLGSEFNRQKNLTFPLSTHKEDLSNHKSNQYGVVKSNERTFKSNRYLVKTKPRYYNKKQRNFTLKNSMDMKRNATLKILIWKQLLKEVMTEDFKKTSVKTLVSILKQKKVEKVRRKKCKLNINENSKTMVEDESLQNEMKTRGKLLEVSDKEEGVNLNNSPCETVEQFDNYDNEKSECVQYKTSENVHSESLLVEDFKEPSNSCNKMNEEEVNKTCVPFQISDSIIFVPKISYSHMKLGEDTGENSNVINFKDSYSSIINRDIKIDKVQTPELNRSITEVLNLLTRPYLDPVDSPRNLSDFIIEQDFNKEHFCFRSIRSHASLNLANNIPGTMTQFRGDSIYSMTPKRSLIISDKHGYFGADVSAEKFTTNFEDGDDPNAIKTTKSWKNGFDIVLQYSGTSNPIKLVEERSLNNNLPSELS